MKKLLIYSLLIAATLVPTFAKGSILSPGLGGGVLTPGAGAVSGSLTPQSSVYYVDLNRSDSYSQNGNILSPYKAFSTAVLAADVDPYLTGIFYLSPGNSAYIDGAPDSFPSSTYINGNQSTYVPASGATFPGSVEIYDTIIAGNLIFSSTSTTQLHQVNNSAIVSGNITANGLINMIGTQILSTTSTFTLASSGLMNFAGGQMNAIGTFAAQSNFNGMQWSGSTSGYGLTQTGCANGGCMNIFGMTYINLIGNGINLASSGASVASGTMNNLTAFSEVLGASATSSVNAGNARTLLCDSGGFYTIAGVFVAPSGTNWTPCIDESRSVLSGLTVGTTTVQTNLAWIATPSSTMRIGVTSTWPGCIEMYDAAASGTLNYVYVSSTALIVTATNPGFCKV